MKLSIFVVFAIFLAECRSEYFHPSYNNNQSLIETSRQISLGPLNILWPNPAAIIVRFFTFFIEIFTGSEETTAVATTTTTQSTADTTGKQMLKIS